MGRPIVAALALMGLTVLADDAPPAPIPSPSGNTRKSTGIEESPGGKLPEGKLLGAEEGYVSEEESRRIWMPQRFEEIEDDPDGSYKLICAGATSADCLYFMFPSKTNAESIPGKLPRGYKILFEPRMFTRFDHIRKVSLKPSKMQVWEAGCLLSHSLQDAKLKRRPVHIAERNFKPSGNPAFQKRIQEIMELAQEKSCYSSDMSVMIAACGGSLEWERLIERRFLSAWDEIDKKYCGNEQPLRDALSALEATDWMPDRLDLMAAVAIASAPHPLSGDHYFDIWPGFCKPGKYETSLKKSPLIFSRSGFEISSNGRIGEIDMEVARSLLTPRRCGFGPPTAELVEGIKRIVKLPSTSEIRRAWALRALADMSESNPDIARVAIPYILSHSGFDLQLATRKCRDGLPYMKLLELEMFDSICQSNLILSLGVLGMHASVKKDKAVLTILRDELLKELKSDSIYKIGNAMRIIICSQMLWSDEKLRTAVATYEKDERSLEKEYKRPGTVRNRDYNEKPTQLNTFYWEAKGRPQLCELAKDVLSKTMRQTVIPKAEITPCPPPKYFAPEDL